MSQRAVEFTDTYTPGKKYGGTRTVTIDHIPGIALTYEGVTETAMTFEVAERIDVLIDRALRSNDLEHQRIAFSASDPESGAPVRSRRRTAIRG
ncbi:MAG TPA: hypothetical protein VHS78_03925 [Candidatus Elarobacter sp.]|jgi:hypothetical protein|nr:hypothetical protein [Candidatus Elarobacter sp.]